MCLTSRSHLYPCYRAEANLIDANADRSDYTLWMKTLIAFLALTGLASAQQSYVVQQYAGQTVLVPLNPVKTRPRQWSIYDPQNPYRVETYDYAGRNGQGYTQAQVEARPVKRYIPPRPMGGVVVILNPFVRLVLALGESDLRHEVPPIRPQSTISE